MKVYSLSGKSGTGKSYRALDLCDKYGIEAIVDDGLLIYNGSIVAGKSAKRQDTTIRAIKTALFKEDTHKNDVVRAINNNDINSILVIGTSERMVNIIADRLELPEPEIRVLIESITTPEEREMAKVQRKEMGQHIIPAPTVEIKKDFSGYFIHPLKMFKDLYIDGRRPPKERSVVRPTYSYLGNYIISDKTVTDIIDIVASDIEGIDSISQSYIKNDSNGIAVEVNLIIKYGEPIIKLAKKFQKQVENMIDKMTALNVISVDVLIDGLMWEQNVRTKKR